MGVGTGCVGPESRDCGDCPCADAGRKGEQRQSFVAIIRRESGRRGAGGKTLSGMRLSRGRGGAVLPTLRGDAVVGGVKDLVR